MILTEYSTWRFYVRYLKVLEGPGWLGAIGIMIGVSATVSFMYTIQIINESIEMQVDMYVPKHCR